MWGDEWGNGAQPRLHPEDVSPVSFLSSVPAHTSFPRAASFQPHAFFFSPVSPPPLFRRETFGSEESPEAPPPSLGGPTAK